MAEISVIPMITQQLRQKLLEKEDPFEDVLGQHKAKRALMASLAAGRHVVLVGPPGIGKTTLVKNIARLLPPKENNNKTETASENGTAKEIEPNGNFVRIQGSPDLTAEDLIGDIDPAKAFKYGPLSVEAFTPGKIFKANHGILFFDELNRCPEKIQNALLQVLEENKATISSHDIELDLDFIFIATMNPEDSSTEKLSDVLMDRFDFIYVEYPETNELEKEIIKKKGTHLIDVPENILDAIVTIVRNLRDDENIEKKPSVRATLGLYECAQTNAMLNKRNVVELKDVQDVMVSVLTHRIRLKPSVRYLKTPEQFVNEAFTTYQKKNLLGASDMEASESGDDP